MTNSYILDKLVVVFRVHVPTLDKILKAICKGVDTRYGVEQKTWIGYGITGYHYNFTVGLDSGESYYIGYQLNSETRSNYWAYCKIEFNPAKVGEDIQFQSVYLPLVAMAKHLEFKRFDVAIDIPIQRSRMRVVKDARRYVSYEYSADNKTEYLGVRSNHGHVKLYNKAMEQKLDEPLTRLEITLDYENSSYPEFKRLFPMVYCIDDSQPDFESGTDLVLMLACRESTEYLKLLPVKRRKKIGQLLREAVLEITPDEISYKNILTEILSYGNRITPEKWIELTENDDIFPKQIESLGQECFKDENE